MTPSSKVRLLSNVPLSNNNEHQMDFTDATTQYNYFYGKASHNVGDNFSYLRQQNAIKVPVGYDSLYDCNYIMFQNSAYGSKWFYGFITDRQYINDNVTLITFELDAWQTYQFDINFHSSFVEREHADRWNTDGSPVLNTVDEGLNYGTDYNVKKLTKYVPYTDVYFLVAVCKQTLHGTPAYTPILNGAPQPLSYYVTPFRMDGTIPTVDIDGAAVSISSVKDTLNAYFQTQNATDNIVSLYVTSYFGLPSNDPAILSYSSPNIQSVAVGSAGTLYVADISTYQSLTIQAGAKYDGFDTVTESKLMMYPYCVIQLSDFRGNTIDFKPQYIWDSNIILKVKGSLGTENKVVWQIDEYNTETLDATDSDIVALENALIDNTPNDIPILNSYLSAFLQGNRNQLNNDLNATLFHGITSTVGSALGGVGMALAKNPTGVVDAGVGLVSAPVDTMFKIQGINAKLKDISNLPPTISKQGSNTSFDWGNGYNGVYLIKKQITPEYQKKLTDFFNMYGYKLNEVKIPNLKTRKYWNYVKTVGALIYGNMPSEMLQKIKDMFNNGVTLWHSDNVGDYSLSNDEV